MKQHLLLFLFLMSSMGLLAIDAPTLTGPENNLTAAFTRQTFRWDAVSGAAQYRLEIDSTISFKSPLRVRQTVTTNQCQVYGLRYGTHYYWRVKSISSDELESGWSAVNEITTTRCATLMYDDDPDMTATYYPNQTLRWRNSRGSTKYAIEVDTTASFTSPGKLRVWSSNSKTDETNELSEEVSNLFLGKMQYWRVKAFNENDSSDWSEVRRFHTLSKAKGKSPSDLKNAYISQKFEWEWMRGLNNVILELDTAQTFDSPELRTYKNFASSQTYAYANVDQMLFGAQYYWRIKAYHQRDTTEWSNVLTFRTYNNTVLKTPADSCIDRITTLNLTWEYDRDVNTYQIQLDTTPNFNSPELLYQKTGASNQSTAYYTVSNLLFGTTYFWRVRGCHARDTTKWSKTFRFTTYYKGTHNKPANGATDISIKPSLYWGFVSSCSKYQVELDTTTSYSSPLKQHYDGSTTISSYAYWTLESNLLYGTTYYWRTRDIHSRDTSDWSVDWAFTTYCKMPKVELDSPESQETVDAQNLTFSWEACEDAYAYVIQIADNGQFSPVMAEQTVTTTQATFSLPEGQVLYWRVQAINAEGRSKWSNIRSITTRTNPTSLDEAKVLPLEKVMIDGQVLIHRGDALYDLLGRKIGAGNK